MGLIQKITGQLAVDPTPIEPELPRCELFSNTRLIDLHTWSWSRVWFTLELAEDCDSELEPCPFGDGRIGAPPRWWSFVEEERYGMIAYALDVGWRCSWEQWALTNGIAPGQPFQLEIGSPTGGGYNSYVGDYDDVECEVDVVAVDPWTDKQIIRAWRPHCTRGALARFRRARRK